MVHPRNETAVKISYKKGEMRSILWKAHGVRFLRCKRNSSNWLLKGENIIKREYYKSILLRIKFSVAKKKHSRMQI